MSYACYALLDMLCLLLFGQSLMATVVSLGVGIRTHAHATLIQVQHLICDTWFVTLDLWHLMCGTWFESTSSKWGSLPTLCVHDYRRSYTQQERSRNQIGQNLEYTANNRHLKPLAGKHRVNWPAWDSLFVGREKMQKCWECAWVWRIN